MPLSDREETIVVLIREGFRENGERFDRLEDRFTKFEDNQSAHAVLLGQHSIQITSLMNEQQILRDRYHKENQRVIPRPEKVGFKDEALTVNKATFYISLFCAGVFIAGWLVVHGFKP